MKHHLRGRAIAVFAIATFLGSAALASTVLRFSNDELTRRADVILHGKCTRAEPREGPNNMVLTDYEFDVIELVKGGDAHDKTFKFSALGGKRADGSGFAISGAPVYAVGEECVLFLDAPHPKNGCRTAIGLAQGKFTVKTEPGTSKKHVVRDLGGLRLVDRTGKLVGIQSADGPKLYLEPFLKEIKSYLGAGTGGKK